MASLLYQTLLSENEPKRFSAKNEDELVAGIKLSSMTKQQAVYDLITEHYRIQEAEPAPSPSSTKAKAKAKPKVADGDPHPPVSWTDDGCVVNITHLPLRLKWMLHRLVQME